MATISAQDAKIGEVIAEAFDKVGKDGVITVEEAPTMGIELEFTEGMQFDKGYISAYFSHRPGADGGRPRGRLHPADRRQDLLDGGLPAAAGEDRADQEAAAGDRRGRGRRGTVDAGRQQDPRPAERGRGEGARLRRPAQGDARGHGRADRRSGRQRGGRPQAGPGRPRRARPGPPRRGDQGHHDDHRRRGRPVRGRGPDPPAPDRDREHRLGLGPGEAAGAGGQAGRRRCRAARWRGHRGRAQGEEAPARGRHLGDQGRHRGGHHPRRRHRARPGRRRSSATSA